MKSPAHTLKKGNLADRQSSPNSSCLLNNRACSVVASGME